MGEREKKILSNDIESKRSYLEIHKFISYLTISWNELDAQEDSRFQ